MISAKEQVKHDKRTHPLNAWLAGGTPDGSPRWGGDDGRVLVLAEFQFWPEHIQAAEQAKFAALDADYEVAKASLAP